MLSGASQANSNVTTETNSVPTNKTEGKSLCCYIEFEHVPLKEIPSISLIDDKLPEQQVRTDFELPTQPPRVDKETHNVVSHYQWQSTDLRPILQYLRDGIVPNDQTKAI